MVKMRSVISREATVVHERGEGCACKCIGWIKVPLTKDPMNTNHIIFLKNIFILITALPSPVCAC